MAAFEERYQVKLAWSEPIPNDPLTPPGLYKFFAATERDPGKNFSITYDADADTLINDNYLPISYEEQFREEFGIQHTGFPYLDLALIKVRTGDSDPEGKGPPIPSRGFRDGFQFSSEVGFEKDLSEYRKRHDDLAVALRFYMGLSDLSEEKLGAVTVLLDRFEELGQTWTKMDVIFFDDAFLAPINMHQPRLEQLESLRSSAGKKAIHIFPHPDLPNPTPAEMLKYIDPGDDPDCFFAESHDIYTAALGYGDERVEDPIKMLEDLVAQYDPRFGGGRFWQWGYTLRAATELVEYYLENENRVKAKEYLDLLRESGELYEWWSFDEYEAIEAKLYE